MPHPSPKMSHRLPRRRARWRRERGVVLIVTLLLLTMMGALTLAMVLSVSSDSLINGYYRNYRGSFYAADSGVNIARQAMVAGVLAAVPATFTTGTPPIPTGTATTVQNSVLSAYASNTPINTAGASGSWR